MPHQFFYPSPVGILQITTDVDVLTELVFTNRKDAPAEQTYGSIGRRIVRELNKYFAGEQQVFDINLKATGTPFHESVWRALCMIPYADTAAYADIARKIKSPNAVRAVGTAIGRNPICIIIPCHRIISSDGSMGGYSGGLWRKKWLLEHEQKHF